MEENEIFKGMDLWRLLIDDNETTTLKQPKYKSTMEIGNVKVNNIKRFNWIQKIFLENTFRNKNKKYRGVNYGRNIGKFR